VERNFSGLARAGPGLAGPPGGDDRLNDGAGSSTCCRAKKSTPDQQALGRSRGGLTTKIHALVDALGNPIRIEISPGQAGDAPYGAVLLADCEAFGVIADKAYDADWLLEGLAYNGSDAVIPSKVNRVEQRVIDQNLYADRNKIERYFNKLNRTADAAVSPGGYSLRKDRREFFSDGLSGFKYDIVTINVHRL
jgi:putative transposase